MPSRGKPKWVLTKVMPLLERQYGHPRHGNPQDPLDDLIYLKLSQQTNEVKFAQVYATLRSKYQTWGALAETTEAEIAADLEYLGFHNQRGRQIKQMLAQIKADVGVLDLSWLRGTTPDEAIAYLRSLPGVGVKTAYGVAMYALGCDVLPVDTHTERISKRLGLLDANAGIERAHKILNILVPHGERETFHVTCVSHGREVCTTSRPRCDACCINRYCKYFRDRKTAPKERFQLNQCHNSRNRRG